MIPLKILTHSGGEYEAAVELFDPVLLNDQLNNNEINTVVIGDLIFSRIDVKTVAPIKEEVL